MASRHVMRGSTRRTTSWFSIPETVNVVGAGVVALVATLNAAALASWPFTIIRTILEVHIQSDQLAVDENQIAAVGMAVTSF